MPNNIIVGLVVALLVVLVIFGAIAGLIVIYHRSKSKSPAKLEPGDRGYEREAKIFTLYQNLEDMLDGFDTYIEETRASFEMEKIELLRGREEISRMHANILALSEKMDKQFHAVSEEKDALASLRVEMKDEVDRLTALRAEIEAQKAEIKSWQVQTQAAEKVAPPAEESNDADLPEEAFIPTRPHEITRPPVAPSSPAPAGRRVSLAQEPPSRQIMFPLPVNPEPAATSTSGRAETIRNLHKGGMGMEDIARELGIARNEVALTLKLMNTK